MSFAIGLKKYTKDRIRLLYIANIGLSAFLLFLIQPLFSKITLPLLGGSTMVWSTAMVFFQITLLLGYLYAHLLSHYLTVKWQVISHVSLCFVATLFLPLAISVWFQNPSGDVGPFWLLALYAVSIGVPFFAVSANAPLLQSWYAKTGQEDSTNPYFLYSASNIGSAVALLGYPLIVEPGFTLETQTILWSLGFFALTFMLIKTGFKAEKNHEAAPASNTALNEKREVISPAKRLTWLLYAFVPSALLLAFTNHITLDMASIPLFWILPLFLYLMTFVLAFSTVKWRPGADQLKVVAHFFTIPLLCVAFILPQSAITMAISLLVSLIAFFLVVLYMHTRLADERPGTQNLTQFYVFQSLGGVFGGMAVALVAPVIFDRLHEFVILILVVTVLTVKKSGKTGLRRIINEALLPALLICISVFFIFKEDLGVIDAKRSYFGAYKIEQSDNIRIIFHGTTIHGAESLNADEHLIPQTYYVPKSGVGLVLAAANNAADIGVIGLGSGSLSCYYKPGQNWTFYEIDPLVVDLAREHFNFLNECAKGSDIILGDARISLTKKSDKTFDYLVVDAFSSDAVPIHLLTVEAIQLYFDKLKDGGTLLMHVSNRYFDLQPPITRIARELGLSIYTVDYDHTEDDDKKDFATSSKWLIIQQETEEMPSGEKLGIKLDLETNTPLWTDNYSHLLGVLR